MVDSDPVTGYVDAVAARLRQDGCEVTRENWNGSPVIVGHRADFKLRWMGTRLHLFTIVSAVPVVTVPVVEGFTNATLDYAIDRKGALRGMQSGVAVLAGLVTVFAEPAAVEWAAARQRVRFAAMARPVVVDTHRRVRACYRGTPALGAVYAGHLRRKLDAYFPSFDADSR